MSKEINKDVEFNDDIFDSMVYGTFDESSVEDAGDTSEDLEDDNEYEEDTDQDAESEDDEELDEDRDGDADEDLEDTDEDEEEHTPVEAYDSDDEDGDVENEEDEADEAEESEEDDTNEESEETTETDDTSDGKGQDTDAIDYKSFYEAVVNTEFVVNGKKVKGFADPKKIIQSQQMAGGFSEKMAGFKKYRPFMSPLQERGMLEDQAKFDLAMNLIDGDKEAIKLHLQSLNIDPLDLDMEAINYSAKRTIASPESLIIEDTMERAKSAGIEERVRKVVGTDWDAESFQEFVSNEHVRNDLLNHIETGTYDVVTDKMGELSRLDFSGTYSSMSTVNKYREAVKALQAENASRPATAPVAERQAPKAAPVSKESTVKAEKAKIVKSREEEKYKEEAAKREATIAQQRKRAASMSKKKAKAKPKAQFDPMKVEGEELDNLMDLLISGARG